MSRFYSNFVGVCRGVCRGCVKGVSRVYQGCVRVYHSFLNL